MSFNSISFETWLYGMISVVIISLIGFTAILMIPMISKHQNYVIQLLVGLAIGTLTSDATLHLIPHAFIDEHHDNSHDNHTHSDHDSDDNENHSHSRSFFLGLMFLTGIIGFLLIQRIVIIFGDICNSKGRKTVKVANCNLNAGNKLSNHNICNEETNPETQKLNETSIEDNKKGNVELQTNKTDNCANDIQLATEQCHRETIVYQHRDPDKSFVVQLTDHHHHHKRNHNKTTKQSIIMMIVTTDSLHNFFDGLAIGVAYAGGFRGGISTSLAILCHELPHEIGDFAVLVNAGMSTRKAAMYNIYSSILCLIGMTVGVFIGKMNINFLYAVIAGMFLYTALVNMMPQLDCCLNDTGPSRAWQLSTQIAGISLGVICMSLISLSEANFNFSK